MAPIDSAGKATWSVTSSDDGSSLEVKTTGGNPMNLMYQMPSKPTYYFEVTVTEISSRSSSLSVGVVRPEEFQKGYGIEGMFYNGNLTNGSAALKTSYGPRVQKGDVLLVEYIETLEIMQIILHLNGTCLGTGFQISKTKSPFVPCVSVQGQMKFQAKFLSEKPEVLPRQVHPLSGKWNVIEAGNGVKQLLPVPNVDKKIVLSVEHQEGDVWNLSIHVFNTLRIRKRISPGALDKHFDLENCDGQGAICSTRMMAPAPFNEVEVQLPDCMELSWLQMELMKDHKTMHLRSDGNTTVATCIRQESTGEAACTSYK
jgi:hypothetical protein